MLRALELANQAYALNEVPIGCVIVDLDSNSIIASAHNQSNLKHDPTLHAEMIAIKDACALKGSKVLGNTAIYISVEPCAMCAAAISYAQISKIFYGAAQPKLGAIESTVRYFDSKAATYKPEIYGGMLEEQSRELMQKFFDSIRDLSR